jgi:uncharacterized protein YbjT (DUF2867 family)
MSIRNVLIIGATGNLGPSIVAALTPHFTVTIDPSFPHDAMVKAFTGQDAVVVTTPGADPSIQKRFIDAALEAGVKRFMPSEFGGDTMNIAHDVGIDALHAKRDVIAYLESKTSASDGSAMSYTALATGNFFDWGITVGFLKISPSTHTATLLDDGTSTWPATTLAQIGRAVAAVLSRPEATRNRYLYVQSFSTSQRAIVDALERVQGVQYKVEKASSKEVWDAGKASLAGGNFAGLYDMVLVFSTANKAWEDKETFANELLELPKQDFDEEIKKVVDGLK